MVINSLKEQISVEIQYLKLTFIYNDSNCKLNDEIVTELKKKLTTAENKLTDIRLEALTSVHQIDQLKEYMEKMRV